MTTLKSKAPSCHFLGRYVITETIASGGMASIHLGRLTGAEGFVRTVAIKRLLPTLAGKGDYSAMFLDEARIAARIQHPNVAQTLDAVSEGGEFFIVMEYVHGETLLYFLKKMLSVNERLPFGMVGAVFSGLLQGLHAAHIATDEDGSPLGIIHRDVSPQNVMIGVDGVPRLLDFGVAKGEGRKHQTQEGQIKGKLMYMSPEQLRGHELTRTTDLFSTGALLWEALAGEALLAADDEVELLSKLLTLEPRPPSALAPGITAEMDAVVMKALERDPRARFQTAAEMATAVERAFPVATQREVGEWVALVAERRLSQRSRWMEEIERVSSEVHQRRQDGRTQVLGSVAARKPASAVHIDLTTGDREPHREESELRIATTLRPATPSDLVLTAPPKAASHATAIGLGGKGGTVPISAAQMGEIEAMAAALKGGAPALPVVPDLDLGASPTPSPQTAKGTVMMFDAPVAEPRVSASVAEPSDCARSPAPPSARHAALEPERPEPLLPAGTPVVPVAPASERRGMNAGVQRGGFVDHSTHARRRPNLRLPGQLFTAAVLMTVADVVLTRTTGIVLAFGPVRPSWIAGVLAALAVLLAAVALARPREP